MDAVGLPVGTRVKLRPRAGGDVFDLALGGQDRGGRRRSRRDMEGRVFVGVLVDDDPGRDLGERGAPVLLLARRRSSRCGVPGRRDRQRVPRRRRRSASSSASAASTLPTGVDVVDFGIRGMDLAYALGRLRRRSSSSTRRRAASAPGTLYVIEPDLDELPLDVDAHGDGPGQGAGAGARRSAARCRGRSCSGASRPAVGGVRRS